MTDQGACFRDVRRVEGALPQPLVINRNPLSP